MWPFFKSKKQAHLGKKQLSPELAEAIPEKRKVLSFEQLLDGMARLESLAAHNAALKFWLPEPVAKSVNELSKLQGCSMSVMLREFLAVHAYGLYPVQLLIERNPRIFKESNIRCSIDFNISDYIDPPGKKRVNTYFVPELGKNVVPVKLWLASALRDDLQILADHVGIKLSQYIREIVISRLLGHGTLPKRPEMLVAEPLETAEKWCDGEKVEMRIGTKDEYRLFADSDVTTAIVDDDETN